MSPEAFALAWGADDLIRLPPNAPDAPVPAAARQFLAAAGLPALVRCGEGESVGHVTFCRLAGGLAAVPPEGHFRPPPGWAGLWVAGDEFFCQGHAWWCVDGRTGGVVRADPDRGVAQPANAGVAEFAAALIAACRWSAAVGGAAGGWADQLAALGGALVAADPGCMASAGGYWPAYLEFMRREGPGSGWWAAGSRADGERAWRTGSW